MGELYWRKIFMKQSVDKCNKLTSAISGRTIYEYVRVSWHSQEIILFITRKLCSLSLHLIELMNKYNSNGVTWYSAQWTAIYLNLFTDCFMNISLHSSKPDEWREIFMKQSVKNSDKLTSVISVMNKYMLS